MRKQTVDIVEDLVKKLTVDITINKVIDNGDGTYSLEVDNTYWLSIGDDITIDEELYRITSIIPCLEITVKPISGAIPVETVFTLPAPNYYHGTLKMTQNEVDAVLDKTAQVPFVWLFEIIRDRKNTNRESTIDRDAELRIFFVNSANYKDWLTDDHYTNVFQPLQSMVELFISNIKKDRANFSDDLDYDCINLANFSTDGAQNQSTFDTNLSAIELDLSLSVKKNFSCIKTCKPPTPPPPIVCPKDITIRYPFIATELDARELTIDAFTAGTYNSIDSDVLSGAITINVNGGGDLPFTPPLVLEIGDSLVIKRSSDVDDGYVDLIGFYE